MPAQWASDTLVTVYVVVDEGCTLRVAGEAPALWTRPSDQVRVHGPTPVRVAAMSVELPWQIVAVPLTVAVGSARTATVVVAAVDSQPLTATMTLYRPALAGVTPAITGFWRVDVKPLGPTHA